MIVGRLFLVVAGAAIFCVDVHAQSPRILPQSAPSVILTSPQANEVVSESLTPTILLQATVTTGDAPISQVIFYVCPSVGTSCAQPATIATTLTASPYEYVWTPPRTVTQTSLSLSFAIWATAVNTLGQAASSTVIPITVIQPPPAPSIILVAPKNDSGFVTPASPVLYATASPGSTNPPSTLTMVEFFDGDTLIGAVSQPNATPSGYALTWPSAAVGIHLISARATDSLGYSTFSMPIVVYVVGPDPAPLVGLGSPATGQVFGPLSTIPLSATASSALGTIQRVEFVAADRVVATLYSPPYATNWVNPPPGNFAVTATAHDDIGVAATSPAAYIQVLPAPRLPVVVVTAPASGSSSPSGQALALAASAIAPDGAIGRVDFYAGANLLGSATSAPYQHSWPNPASGPQSVSAKVVDLEGNVGTSATVPITIVNNAPPTVELTSPTSGAQFTAPATIALAAIASDSDGSVAKVEFFAGATKVGTATAAPFTSSWNNVAAGSYTLTAVATDNVGATGTSAAAVVSVSAPVPTATLSAPQNGATFAVGESIPVTAQASALARSVARVEFYSDGALISATTVSGAPTAITINLSWNSASVGPHVLYAKVITTDQASATSASVNVTVTDLGVSITEPSSGQTYTAPAEVHIAASTSSSESQITRVEFYGDEILLGTATTVPYALNWSGVTEGPYQITAKVFDTSGYSATSAPIAIIVQAGGFTDLVIVSPASPAGVSASVTDDSVLVHGTYTGPINTGITVNGVVAETDGRGHFALNSVPLDIGTNTIDVALTTIDGQTATKSTTVARTGDAPFRVVAVPDAGFAPFTTLLSAISRRVGPVTHVDVTNLGGGTFDGSLFDGQTLGKLSFASPGFYLPRVTLTYANNRSYSQTVAIVVKDAAEIDGMFLGMFNRVVSLLRSRQKAMALTLLTEPNRSAFEVVFNELDARLPQIVDTFSGIGGISLGSELATYALKRAVGDGVKIFLIEYMRDSDGVWRIDSW